MFSKYESAHTQDAFTLERVQDRQSTQTANLEASSLKNNYLKSWHNKKKCDNVLNHVKPVRMKKVCAYDYCAYLQAAQNDHFWVVEQRVLGKKRHTAVIVWKKKSYDFCSRIAIRNIFLIS